MSARSSQSHEMRAVIDRSYSVDRADGQNKGVLPTAIASLPRVHLVASDFVTVRVL